MQARNRAVANRLARPRTGPVFNGRKAPGAFVTLFAGQAHHMQPHRLCQASLAIGWRRTGIVHLDIARSEDEIALHVIDEHAAAAHPIAVREMVPVPCQEAASPAAQALVDDGSPPWKHLQIGLLRITCHLVEGEVTVGAGGGIGSSSGRTIRIIRR